MDETLPWVIAKEIMSKLISFASDEEEEEIMSLFSSWGFKGEGLKRLQETAEKVQALLFDATTNRKNQWNESVGTWLKKLNTVAYDADAVLEEFNYEALRWKLEINSNMDKVRRLFSFRLKITNINESLDEIYKQGTQIGLIRLQGVKSLDADVQHTQIRLTHPFEDDSEVWGRNYEVLMMVNELCFSGNENHLSVIAIYGMEGLGKTTLARLVCNHDKVVRHFDEIIRITVSDDFDVTRLLNEMVQSLTRKNLRLSNVDEIVKNELRGRLKGKRYLLVLDDVWNQDHDKWDCLRKALLAIGTSRGSKIMVTTLTKEVALMMQAYFIHKISFLSVDVSWARFKHRAFAKGGAMETPDMVNIGREIVKRFWGLPLEIRALGGLMYSKKSETAWQSILSYMSLHELKNALQICYE